MALSGPTVAADGTTSVILDLADDAGRPLDRTGLLTLGQVELQFVYAVLDPTGSDGGTAAYASYTNRFVPGPFGSRQSTAEADGAFAPLGQGRYRYTLVAKADPARASWSHLVVASASRTFEGQRQVATGSIGFVPDGATPAARPAVVGIKKARQLV